MVKPYNTDAPGICADYGIQRTSNRYITIIDSDDFIVPTAISEILSFIHTMKADLAFTKKLEDWGTYTKLSVSSTIPYSYQNLLKKCCIGQLCVYTRELYNKVGGFNPEFKCAAEYDLYLRMAKSGAVIKHYPKVLYHINRRPGHESRVLSNKRTQGFAELAIKVNSEEFTKTFSR